MSKINAIRIINLNYNNNTMKVNDETFELGGESTLLCLRNGGGKSVMVQMAMAPFVNARYRDSKDRKFENYFKSNIPTYILTEWLLDNNSGYVLTGMGIKRGAASSDEEAKNELEIITFIHEYKQGNKYDIHNFPVTEKTEKGFKVKSFANIRGRMDEIKADRNYIFNYYELSIDSQRKKYFEALKQYSINNREWESIIKKINLKESGLSDLFQEAKTIAGLVEKWFLPTVSDKLNDKDDKIKSSQEIIQKFIYQYKENQNKIIRKQGIEDFKNYSIKILNSAEDFQSVKLNTESIKNDIANLYFYISSQIEKLVHDKENIDKELLILKDELNEIEYEKLSFEYHKLNEKLLVMKEEEEELQKLIEELDIKINECNHEIEILECSKLYENYKELSKQVQVYENKLDLARAKDSEKQSERNNIGFTLRKIYEEIVLKQKDEAAIKDNEIKEKDSAIKNLKNNNEQLQKRFNQLNKESAALEANVTAYNEKENKFNLVFGQRLKRNVLGEYDEVLIDSYNKDFEKRLKASAQLLNQKQNVAARFKEELNKSRSEQESEKIKEKELKMELINREKDLEELNNKINEINKILLYANIDDSKLYDRECIVKQLIKKLDILRNEKDSLSIELNKFEQDKKMYETGRNIKLSREIEERLVSLDITLVFGLEWLKKQNISIDKKNELIKNNPFLPYSLIMTKSSLEKLKKEESRVFTSIPLSIIEQEMLDERFEVSVANDIYTIGNMNFFISFNDKLLNEEELKKLLSDINSAIDKIKNQISIKDNEIEEYTRHKQKVEDFNVKKSDLTDMQNKIGDISKEITAVQNKINLLIDKVSNLEININTAEQAIKEAESRKLFLENEGAEFKELSAAYEKYKAEKNSLYEKKNALKDTADELENAKLKIDEETALLDKFKEQLLDIKERLRQNEKSCSEYSNFKEGQVINKDTEDLEARYKAITSGLGSEIKDIEDFLNNTRRSFERTEKELVRKANEYKLQEVDYREVIYDNIKEMTLKEQRHEIEKEEKYKNQKLHKLQLDITRKENEVENKLKDINKLDKENPKDKIYITNLEFDSRKEMKNKEIDTYSSKIEICIASIASFKSSKDKMDEYAMLKINEEKIFDFTCENVEKARVSFIKSYRESIENEEVKAKILSVCCSELSDEARFTVDEFFKNTIDILSEIKSRPEDVIKTLETVNEVHKKMLEQLETDLEKVEVEKNNIIEMLYEYVQQIYEHLERIDDNSTININGRYVKMLEIIQPKWEEKEEYYRLQVKDFLESLTQNCLDELARGKNIEELISKEITTNKLYDNVVGISEIDIKLYKIEASKQIKISWNQVSENSGGEGFLSAFVILSSLLSYMRKEESDIFKTSQEGKVLIMDNPFAQTNAEHLLKPLMDIAKKNNTQLICFTGLGGDSIYNRFDNIYVLNLLESKLKQGMQYIESEHKKGEEIVHLTSSRFRIHEEKAEQMMLF